MKKSSSLAGRQGPEQISQPSVYLHHLKDLIHLMNGYPLGNPWAALTLERKEMPSSPSRQDQQRIFSPFKRALLVRNEHEGYEEYGG